jgi:hypothetical protein
MTTADLLKRLNELRAATGQKPIKSWKESKAKLEVAVAALEPSDAPADDGDTLTAAQIAKSIGLDPRIARAILRKSDLPHARGKGWTFPAADKAAVVAILKAGKK